MLKKTQFIPYNNNNFTKTTLNSQEFFFASKSNPTAAV